MLYKRDDRKLVKISPEKIVPSPYQPRREFDYYELLQLKYTEERTHTTGDRAKKKRTV